MCGQECSSNFAEMTTSTPFRDLLHAANLQHRTNGFTSPPKEGVLRIFRPEKSWRLRPGLNPRTWVLKGSTLPLDHQAAFLRPNIAIRCPKWKNRSQEPNYKPFLFSLLLYQQFLFLGFLNELMKQDFTIKHTFLYFHQLESKVIVSLQWHHKLLLPQLAMGISDNC